MVFLEEGIYLILLVVVDCVGLFVGMVEVDAGCNCAYGQDYNQYVLPGNGIKEEVGICQDVINELTHMISCLF